MIKYFKELIQDYSFSWIFTTAPYFAVSILLLIMRGLETTLIFITASVISATFYELKQIRESHRLIFRELVRMREDMNNRLANIEKNSSEE